MRQTLNFNRDWQFHLGDVAGAEAPAFDGSRWQSANLPHSFSLPYFGAKSFYVGYGWYRKTFVLPADWRAKKWSLEFEGVFQDAELWLNGQPIGRHRGGYTGFEFEVSGAARAGQNVLAVRVNNLWDARLAPRAGEHVFSGGIYRDVWLVAKNPLHIAWNGTAVSTPDISHESATVRVETEVCNATNVAKTVTVRQSVFAPDGRSVMTWQSAQKIGAGATATVSQTSPPIPFPRLWHPDDPALYRVVTQVFDGASLADETASLLGFRWFEWSAERGFFLNGEHLYLRGANVHQDHAGWGDAVTNAGFERDVQMAKDAGFNFLRGSHYPHDPAFSAACDRLGILLWSENAFWGIGGFGPDGYWNSSAYPPAAADQPAFEASVRAQLREMVRIHRNHPSIIAWSLGNETFFTEPSTLPKMKAFLGELVEECHQLDPTRPVAVGGAQRPLDENRIDLVGDIAGYNGDGASLPVFQNPGVPNLVSEYGSVTARRPGPYAPGWDHLAKDNGQPVHPWRAGQAIWCLFDHGSLAGENLGRMGIVDYFRLPKRAWYWYRNEYRHIPPPAWPVKGVAAKLRLHADKTTLGSDGTDGAQLVVAVLDAQGRELSNALPIALEIVSGPGELPTGRSISFAPDSDIAMLDGKAAIEFRAYHAGKTRLRASSPGLPVAEIELTLIGDVPWIEGVTQAVAARPYVRFDGKGAQVSANADLAASRPTKASSSAPNLTSASINDGKTDTFWRPAPDDQMPWVQVDLENTYALHRVQLRFGGDAPHRFQIAVTRDGDTWETVLSGVAPQNEFVAEGDFGTGIRAIRILPEPGATLYELRVGGR